MDDPLINRLFEATHLREAEEFLASGGKPLSRGFDLADPQMRAELLSRTGADFIDFQLHPLPAPLEERLRRLPPDWQDRPETHAEAESLNLLLEQHFALPAHLYVSINDRREAWVHLR